ncbi:hypothetical protein [Streptomyces sp. NPDC000405]|uniref:scabin-related ADP-ribosyltransferase n=1 Tax=Streptomyces sp. NPDC000405 TaxID=3161033 RepID=UPI00398D0E0E
MSAPQKDIGIAVTFPLGAKKEGCIYEIEGAPGGIDANEAIGAINNQNSREAEVSFDGGIPWQYVKRI